LKPAEDWALKPRPQAGSLGRHKQGGRFRQPTGDKHEWHVGVSDSVHGSTGARRCAVPEGSAAAYIVFSPVLDRAPRLTGMPCRLGGMLTPHPGLSGGGLKKDERRETMVCGYYLGSDEAWLSSGISNCAAAGTPHLASPVVSARRDGDVENRTRRRQHQEDQRRG